MHGRQVGGDPTETGGHRVDLDLLDRIRGLTVRQVVGAQKAQRQGLSDASVEGRGCVGGWVGGLGWS